MEVEVISRERIKPSSPTPSHLKTHKISLLDQLFPPVHVPLVFFYLNTQTTSPIPDVISKTSVSLKQSLAKTLTLFYPFAGKIKDHLSVDCNDEGVYYVEAPVDNNLSEFLSKPDVRLTQHFLPHDQSMDQMYPTGISLVMIQVNFFKCGGMALGMYCCHRIIDGHTCITFVRAWAETAQGSGTEVIPRFVPCNSLFPQNPSLPKDSTLLMWPSMFNQSKYVTRRFLFDASALNSLKAKVASSSSFVPTRVEALLGLIWKCAISASKSRFGFQRPSVLSLAVSLRSKFFPPPSQFAMGNLLWSAVAQSKADTGTELHRLVRNLRDATSKINGGFVRGIQGGEGFSKVTECLKELRELYSNEGANYYACTSTCNLGMYDADFGWGKPIWVTLGGNEDPMVMNLIYLLDTRSGGGIEAWVNLSEEDMAEFERDHELLAFTSLDPSPLHINTPSSHTVCARM
ncbi:hypothetical protein RHSIM_Rhsim13G0141900 [Rhododendron simsii]|uniref:Uncharacterized protein n=1 Tax=Rhododendron simsii TaxID=118357 RepID=A0A834G000_RHOSS|nr:hypothetical protein RHSIM_Rhsim13G0141900 [Rhododendron simsii]